MITTVPLYRVNLVYLFFFIFTSLSIFLLCSFFIAWHFLFLIQSVWDCLHCAIQCNAVCLSCVQLYLQTTGQNKFLSR